MNKFTPHDIIKIIAIAGVTVITSLLLIFGYLLGEEIFITAVIIAVFAIAALIARCVI